MSVYTKLNEAREKFHALKLEKTGENKFAKYKYFELGDFLIPALKVFKEVGLCAVVSFDADMASMAIVDVDKPEDGFRITSPMGSADLKGCHIVQNIGAVETYQRRYLWVAALEIVEHDALDATTGKKGDGPVILARPATEDLNLTPEQTAYLDESAAYITDCFKSGDVQSAKDFYANLEAKELNSDELIALNNMLDSKIRTAMKAKP